VIDTPDSDYLSGIRLGDFGSVAIENGYGNVGGVVGTYDYMVRPTICFSSRLTYINMINTNQGTRSTLQKILRSRRRHVVNRHTHLPTPNRHASDTVPTYRIPQQTPLDSEKDAVAPSLPDLPPPGSHRFHKEVSVLRPRGPAQSL
jgi:hypothetical protein